jgi:hypothetical protein
MCRFSPGDSVMTSEFRLMAGEGVRGRCVCAANAMAYAWLDENDARRA